MKNLGRRAYVLVGLGAIAVPLAAAALAYGCTAAATLASSPGAASAGATVTVTGKYFKTHETDSPGSAGPVEIRLGSITGPVLASATPAGPDRAISVQITVPSDAAVGESFISATQFESNGTPVYGTPARQAFRVTAPPAAAGGAATAGSQIVTTLLGPPPVATLSMTQARRLARAHVKRKNRRAKRIRTSCARRSRTSAVCRVRYRAGRKTVTKKLVVRSSRTAATG